MTLTLGCRALAPRRAWRQDPPARRPPGGVYRAGGKRRPTRVPAALACGGDDAAAIVVAAVAGPLLPANAANAGAADVLGRRFSPPLAVAPLLLRQLLLQLQLPWGVGVCVWHNCYHDPLHYLPQNPIPLTKMHLIFQLNSPLSSDS